MKSRLPSTIVACLMAGCASCPVSMVQSASDVEKKLDAIMLPTFNMEEVTIGWIFKFLGEASREFDQTGATPKGVVFVVAHSLTNAVVSVIVNSNPNHVIGGDSGPFMSLRRFLDVICQQTGLKAEVRRNRVVIVKESGGQHHPEPYR